MEDLYKDKQCKNAILAYGEASGHAHQFDDVDLVEVYKSKEHPEQMFIDITGETKLVHGRARDFTGREADHDYHQPIIFSPGQKIMTGIVKETDWLTNTIRRVID